MTVFDDPRRNLHWMNEALLREEDEALREDAGEEIWDGEDGTPEDPLEEELEEIYQLLDSEPASFSPRPRVEPAPQFSRSLYPEDPDFADGSRYVPAPRKKGIKGLVLLALLEICGILVLLGWWFGWWT